MCKQKKSIKGLKFGCLQNFINDVISTGVIVDDSPSIECLNDVPNSSTPQNAMQYNFLLDPISEEVTMNYDKDDNDSPGEMSEADEVGIYSPAKSLDAG